MQRVADIASTINGAVSIPEMYGINWAVKNHLNLPTSGIGVDLGAHAGRSTLPAVLGMEGNLITKFYMVDLLYDLKNPNWKHTTQKSADVQPWGYANDPGFNDMVRDRIQKYTTIPIELVGEASFVFLETIKEPINYAFIDSDDHQLDLIQKEIALVDPLMPVGGLILFHDFRSQYVAPAQVADSLVASGRYQEIQINWQEAIDYTKNNNLKSNENSWHMCHEEFPCYAGCIKKVR